MRNAEANRDRLQQENAALRDLLHASAAYLRLFVVGPMPRGVTYQEIGRLLDQVWELGGNR